MTQYKMAEMIYFDNNATTFMAPETIQTMRNWCNLGNPSSSYKTAENSRIMMNDFRKAIGNVCNVNTCCGDDRDVKNTQKLNPKYYRVIFNSGASESNSTIITSCIDAASETTGKTPHIVASAIEHKSILLLLKSFKERGKITLTLVNPGKDGAINPADVKAAITRNTALVCIMHANNETGIINDIEKIGAIAHDYGVPFHCDTVQTMGKYPLSPLAKNVDSFCISFHKLHGPPGVGALIIKQDLINKYKLNPLIFGAQEGGFRGGTENIPGIAAAFSAFNHTLAERAVKNKKLLALKKEMIRQIHAEEPRFPMTTFEKYSAAREFEIVIFDNPNCIPNTLFLAVVRTKRPYTCNAKIKKYLEGKKVIVSVGSACNTADPSASHVVNALGFDEHLRRGVLRISLDDDSTVGQVCEFVRLFKEAVLSVRL